MTKQRFAPVGFMIAAVLFLFAAVVPTFDGGRLNATFLTLGIVFLVLAMTMMRRSRGSAV